MKDEFKRAYAAYYFYPSEDNREHLVDLWSWLTEQEQADFLREYGPPLRPHSRDQAVLGVIEVDALPGDLDA